MRVNCLPLLLVVVSALPQGENPFPEELLDLVPTVGVPPAPDQFCFGPEKESNAVPNFQIPCKCPPGDDALGPKVLENNPDFPTAEGFEAGIVRAELAIATLEQDFGCPAESTAIFDELNQLKELVAAGNLGLTA